jgi:hypothetical protein
VSISLTLVHAYPICSSASSCHAPRKRGEGKREGGIILDEVEQQEAREAKRGIESQKDAIAAYAECVERRSAGNRKQKGR